MDITSIRGTYIDLCCSHTIVSWLSPKRPSSLLQGYKRNQKPMWMRRCWLMFSGDVIVKGKWHLCHTWQFWQLSEQCKETIYRCRRCRTELPTQGQPRACQLWAIDITVISAGPKEANLPKKNRVGKPFIYWTHYFYPARCFLCFFDLFSQQKMNVFFLNTDEVRKNLLLMLM